MRARGGMSVLEALAVLALLALLLAVALPRLLPPPELEARAVAREFASDAHLARQLAISKGVPFVVEFWVSGGRYSGYTVRAQGGPAEPDFPKPIPPGVLASGPQRVIFSPSGAADVDAEITFRGGGAVARVRIFRATGYARVDPP